MKEKKSNIGKYLLILVPFVMGVTGFTVLDGQPVVDSLFLSMEMYFLNYSDSPPNILIEIARWTAPLMTASGVLMSISKIRGKILQMLRYYRGDSIAVYGDDIHRKEMVQALGSCGIDAGEDWEWVKAKKYLLLGNEDENFRFYGQHREAFAGHTVYLKSENLAAEGILDSYLRLFCPEETAARLYWRRNCLYETSCVHGHHLRIVFLGFGLLGEKLLEYALQDNIFDPKQCIEYHIFGDGAEFQASHRELSKMSDPVIFHEEHWYENIPLLESADRILLLPQKGQLGMAGKILASTTGTAFEVFTVEDDGFELLSGRERLHVVEWEKEAWNPVNVLGTEMFEHAKKLNLHYAHLYGGVEENSENMEREWEKLDGFTRYSNVSAADYHKIRVHMMKTDGWSMDVISLTPEQMELLAELEHIRWCRYHRFHNWRMGIPENGARKDATLRIHKDLIPYDELTEEEKEKDKDNIRMLQKLFAES